MKNLGLIPLRNFAVVDGDKNIYRSAQPMYEYEYEWMKKNLGIDTIVNLRAESRHDNHVGRGLKVINFDVEDHNPPTLEQADKFMKLVNDNGGKLLFHCEHGHGRTSTFCILARLALGWTLEKAFAEEEHKFHYQFNHKFQREFLQKHFGKKEAANA